jgi:hypothetical protein
MHLFCSEGATLSSTTEYIDFVHWFYIFCTKGDSLQISALLRLHLQSAIARKFNRPIGTISQSACTTVDILGRPIHRLL